VAVLPALCPRDLDCAFLDRHVAGEILRRKGTPFVGAEASRKELLKRRPWDPDGPELSAEERVALGEALGAATLLEIRVRELERDTSKKKVDPDDEFETGEGVARRVSGRLEIRALSVRSGELLASATAFGDGNVGSAKGLLNPMATQLLGRMFPLPRR
jgi:hypothetical protein